MQKHFVLTVIADDRPGVVESLANTINRNGGNWLESRMAHFAGKFSGILHLSIAESEAETLQKELLALKERGLTVVIEAAQELSAQAANDQVLHFSIVGNDRSGIVKEVTQAFALRQINLEEIHSEITSAPHVGSPLFEAEGYIRVPEATDLDELEATLSAISNELAVDILLDEADDD